jgi:hypothetical protein
LKKNYQILLGNIVSRLSNSEKHFLFEVVKEEVKRLRKEDIILRGQSRPRPLHWVNRDFYDLSTENLRGLDVIKENLALESPLQALNYLINNISDDVDTVLAIRFLVKCFDSKTGEADLIVEKIKNTFLEKYGVDSPFKLDSFKLSKFLRKDEIEDNRKTTCLEKYGVDNVIKVDEIKLKRKNTSKR